MLLQLVLLLFVVVAVGFPDPTAAGAAALGRQCLRHGWAAVMVPLLQFLLVRVVLQAPPWLPQHASRVPEHVGFRICVTFSRANTCSICIVSFCVTTEFPL